MDKRDAASRTLLMEEVERLIGLGSSSIYNRLDENHKQYDPTFPKQISRGNSTGIGFDEHAILEWMSARPNAPKRQAVKKSPTVSGKLRDPVAATKTRKVAKSTMVAAMEAVLLAAVRSCKPIGHYEFVTAVRKHLGRDDVDVLDTMLNEIDRKAYSRLKVVPSVVIQERRVPIRRAWYKSELQIAIDPTRDFEKFFLATLDPSARKPDDFLWTLFPGGKSLMKPLYKSNAVPRRPTPDPAKVAAEEEKYAKLLPGYRESRGTNRGT